MRVKWKKKNIRKTHCIFRFSHGHFILELSAFRRSWVVFYAQDVKVLSLKFIAWLDLHARNEHRDEFIIAAICRALCVCVYVCDWGIWRARACPLSTDLRGNFGSAFTNVRAGGTKIHRNVRKITRSIASLSNGAGLYTLWGPCV